MPSGFSWVKLPGLHLSTGRLRPAHFLLGLCRWLFFLCRLGRRLALLSGLLALLQVILLLGVLLHQLLRLLLVLLL